MYDTKRVCVVPPYLLLPWTKTASRELFMLHLSMKPFYIAGEMERCPLFSFPLFYAILSLAKELIGMSLKKDRCESTHTCLFCVILQ